MQNQCYSLGECFEQVAKNNHELALKYEDKTLNTSYVQLDILSNQLAHYLLDKEIKKGDVVAIFNNKSPKSFALIIACLKIGAIYTNLDQDSPLYRIQKIADTCNPCAVFFEDYIDHKFANLSLKESAFTATLDSIALDKLAVSYPMLPDPVVGSTSAYIMFTSGSTGTPKGVVISHSNLINFFNWSIPRYEITKSDIFANVSPLYFDNSVFDIYTALFSGATIAPIGKEITKSPKTLVEYVDKLQCTIWFSVPSLLIYLNSFRALTKDTFTNIRIITFGGEGFPKITLKKLFSLYQDRIKFINVYGPTEGTCICSSYDVQADDLVDTKGILPLGTINPNFDFQIVNEHLEPVKPGQQGELLLLGNNVSAGYYNDQDKTQKAFISNPSQKNYQEKAYCTGDLVYQDTKTKLLHFVARKDNQIKHMGYRIELDEIEHALLLLPNVSEAAVIYKRVNDNYGKIFAYVIAKGIKEPLSIINDLMPYLPEYMLPNEIAFLEQLPKNPNGKVDRKALQ
ncbi:amino acid adenylation domain-containing protein [Thalassotalea sediminis]|uniref:amino acid adenylation domain-containing protein n=1 Tax=Thalassotalea sediminis TaxID=1759089 RepID=UPI0025730597|nr:amino acid adenylation domain-containing protein [Thalassotalea sediminis]